MSDSETEIETMAEKVMIEKKPKSDGRKKPRTAAQIAATQRLVEATRKRREDAKAKKDAEQYSALKGKFKKDKPKAKPMPVHESSSEDSSSSSDEEPPATPAPKLKKKAPKAKNGKHRTVNNYYHYVYGSGPQQHAPSRSASPIPKTKANKEEKKEPVKEQKKEPEPFQVRFVWPFFSSKSRWR